jgi:hypothetical protein
MHVTLLRLELIYIIYKDLVRTSQRIKCSSYAKTSRLMLDREMITVYHQKFTEHTYTLCGQNAEFVKSYCTVK